MHLGLRRCSPGSHMQRRRATYLICASLGERQWGEKGEKERKQKSISVYQTRPWEHTGPQPLGATTFHGLGGLFCTGCPSCRTPHGLIQPSCNWSHHHRALKAQHVRTYPGHSDASPMYLKGQSHADACSRAAGTQSVTLGQNFLERPFLPTEMPGLHGPWGPASSCRHFNLFCISQLLSGHLWLHWLCRATGKSHCSMVPGHLASVPKQKGVL